MAVEQQRLKYEGLISWLSEQVREAAGEEEKDRAVAEEEMHRRRAQLAEAEKAVLELEQEFSKQCSFVQNLLTRALACERAKEETLSLLTSTRQSAESSAARLAENEIE